MVTIPSQLDAAKLFPLKSHSKVPSLKWNTDDDLWGTLDPADVPTYAVDTGRSHLVVIDCDTKETANGVASFLEQCMEHGGIPDTFTVSTPNEGLHFYFHAPDAFKVSSTVSRVFGEGVDIRAKGGYIVGPGSLVNDKEGNLKEYTVSDPSAKITELPEWIATKLHAYEAAREAKVKVKATDAPELQEAVTEKEEIEQKLALNWALSRMASVEEGKRMVTLNSLAYFMGRKRVARGEALQLVTHAVEKGLAREEAERAFSKAYGDGLNQPVQDFDVLVREANSKTGTSFKEDPLDPEFYSHFSLSFNFWRRYREELIFWDADGNWYQYEEAKGAWAVCSDTAVKSLLKGFLEGLVESIRSHNTRIPSNIYKAQERLFARGTIENVIGVAKMDFLSQDKELFNSNPYLVNVKNGTFNVKSNEMTGHRKTYFVTKYIPLDYQADAQDKYADLVIDSIAPDQQEYMRILAGQSLVGMQPISQSVFFLHGSGSNGKSTFIDLMLKTSGTYGALQPPSIFTLDKSSHKENYALADFEGLRTAVVEELPDSRFLNTGALKRLVGTQRINARQIYSKAREFENIATIFVSCNRLPMVNETDAGTWRRLTIVSFPYSYKKTKADLRGAHDRLGDPMVLFAAQKQESTAKAFLAWRMSGAIDWAQNNKLEYNIPQSVQDDNRSWNENNDLILSWVTDCLVLDKNCFITATDLYESYCDYAAARGNARISLRSFSSTWREHPYFKEHGTEDNPKGKDEEGQPLKTRADAEIRYRKSAIILAGLTQSPYRKPGAPLSVPQPLGLRPTYYAGLRFRRDNE